MPVRQRQEAQKMLPGRVTIHRTCSKMKAKGRREPKSQKFFASFFKKEALPLYFTYSPRQHPIQPVRPHFRHTGQQ